MVSDNEIRKIADAALRDALRDAGFVESEVRFGLDHDGERAIFVAARFRAGSGPIGGSASIRAMRALSDALLARGEERFPYLINEYPDDERPEDEPRDRRPAA